MILWNENDEADVCAAADMERCKVIMKDTKEEKYTKGNKGFSLVELIIVIAIMSVLVGVLAPQYLSYMHKARVAADWANLKNYYTEITLDYISTGQYNPNVLTTNSNRPEAYKQTEIHFLNGQIAKMKDGYFSVAQESTTNGYQICYYCNECLNDWDKHEKTCVLVLK